MALMISIITMGRTMWTRNDPQEYRDGGGNVPRIVQTFSATLSHFSCREKNWVFPVRQGKSMKCCY